MVSSTIVHTFPDLVKDFFKFEELTSISIFSSIKIRLVQLYVEKKCELGNFIVLLMSQSQSFNLFMNFNK